MSVDKHAAGAGAPEQALPADFGRYRLTARLARGGMAEIFLAEQQVVADVTKVVVLKRILPEVSLDQAYVAMFLDEARLAARLSHPNIVSVFDFGEVDGRYFLTMEYLAGESLGTVMRRAAAERRPVPVPVALRIAIDACEGLHYAHEYGEAGRPMNIVHRDVSPSNVMVTFQGAVKVVDFGIARAVDRLQERTTTGILKGKRGYLSPEHYRELPLDRRADVFALGVVLHELLAGRPLFLRDTAESTMYAVLEEPVPPLRALRDDVPEALDRFVARAIARGRADRYPTARELARDLETLLPAAPLRLDDYLRELFGEERVRARLDVRVPPSEAPPPLRRSGSDAVPTVTGEALGPRRAEDDASTIALRRRDAPVAPADDAATVADDRPPSVEPAGPDAAARPSAPSRRGLWIAIVAMAGIAIGASAWLALRPRDGRYEEAFLLAQRGEHERARTLLDAYLADEPDDADARLLRLLVQWWTTAPHVDEAMEQARAAPLDEAERAAVEALALVNDGRNDAAVAYLEPVRRRLPDRPELLYVLGEAQWHGGDRALGAGTLRAVLDADPRWLMAIHHPASFLLDRRELDAVEAMARRIEPVDPVRAVQLRGEVRIARGEYREAIDLLRAEAVRRRDVAPLWVALSQAYVLAGEISRADEAAERAFEVWPIDDRERGGATQLAELRLYTGEPEECLRVAPTSEAIVHLTEALWTHRPVDHARPRKTGLLSPALNVAALLELATAAGEETRPVWDGYPEPVVAVFGEGLAAERAGRLDAAASAYERALAVPQDGAIRMLVAHHLARVRVAQRDGAAAARACTEVLRPRAYRPYRALLVPDCTLWTAAVAEPAEASRLLSELTGRWRGPFDHPSVVEARRLLPH